jgi:hypothetical protein
LNHFSYLNNNEGSIIQLITKWIVTYSISNNALFALLMSLKSHRCFSNILIDARTILKINFNHLMEFDSVPLECSHYFCTIIKILVSINGLHLTKSLCSTF